MLYLCATPIGNMEDITQRVLRILSTVDAIYAEDTRHSLLLLNHYNIKKPLFSCHTHNEAEKAQEIAMRLKNGETIAYISDAGMPCISDPGERLIEVCVENGLEFTVLPGATASVTALALSGLPTDKFLFYGFLPRSGKERKDALSFICNTPVTTIVYESPNRVYDTLYEIKALAGESRRAAVVREITKVFEQAVRGTLNELCMKYAENPPKGECVIIIEGAAQQAPKAGDINSMICECLAKGMKAKDAAKFVADAFSVPKNDVYKRVLEIKENEQY